MCGIVGYIGHQEAYPILINGLKRLEYRGYDSTGIALLNGDLNIYKKKGKVSNLENYSKGKNTEGFVGIGHTRWATHGKPDDINAHPHLSGNGRLALIHNGIIENYSTLKEALSKLGHTFVSETDTEVLVHLIEEIQTTQNIGLEEAVRIALSKVIGAYAIVVIDRNNPNILVAARKGSPLVVGLGENEYFIGSDATPIIDYTKKVIYLQYEEIAIIKDGHLQIKDIKNEIKNPKIELLDMEIEALEKAGYDYFMLKEIHQQPDTILDCMRGRINVEDGWVHLRGVEEYESRFKNVKKLTIVSCGTSWHAGLIGEYLIEDLVRLPVEVEYASEFRYRNPIVGPEDVVIALSQSGETADTLAALELSKDKWAVTYGIVNAVGSSIARTTHAGSYIHAGPEIGVASTKAFTGQVTLLTIMALKLAIMRGTITKSRFQEIIIELEKIPSKIKQVLEKDEQIKYIASEIKDSTNAIYLGRGVNFPVALEGALKLKEISYIHAEGYPAAEMKHGPIALIDEKMPVIVIATNKNAYDKIVSNVQEVKARKGIVIAIVNEGDVEIAKLADYYIEIPETDDLLSPLLSVIPLQLLSYHIALMRGCNVDQPRNLAKSVTVE
ncbi:MAG: glutamine--fructose-6-phosphate transaminase (isomerizing) [Bacteroidetes bacterium]|nr:glutamine--fructose-6-phosphate transaminase (isomerizing) [Bacteroidota bacterium]